jgi:hypothetical protein
MPLESPTLDEIADIAEGYGLSLDDGDVGSFQGLMRGTLESYARLDELTEPTLPVKYPRTPGFRPQPEDNSFNGWYWRAEITGEPSGPLTGKPLTIKDNVCVAGVPLMNGSSVLEGYTPEIDAMARGLLTRPDDLSETVKLTMLASQYMQERYHGRYYAEAQNLSRSMSAAYDAALQKCDLLVMPTLPLKASKIPPADVSGRVCAAGVLNGEQNPPV